MRVRVLTLVGLTPRPRQRRAQTLRKFGRNQAYGALRKARGKGGSRSTDSGPMQAWAGARCLAANSLTCVTRSKWAEAFAPRKQCRGWRLYPPMALHALARNPEQEGQVKLFIPRCSVFIQGP